MPNLGAFLSAVPGGYQQGQSNQMTLQDQALNLRDKAMRIQQAQAAIDQQKKTLAAEGQFLMQQGQQQGGGAPQPPAPGQSSVPNQPPQPASVGPGMPSNGPGPGATAAPAAPSPGGMPMGGGGQPQPQPRPQPQQPPAGGAPGQPPGAPGQGQQQGGPPDAQKVVISLAQKIKQANPNIDPATLATATEHVIGLMRGVEPDIKAQMQAEVQVYRIQSQAEAQVMRAQTAEQVANIRADSAKQIADLRIDAAKQLADKKQSQGEMSDDTIKWIANAAKTDPSILSRMGWGQAAQANKNRVFDELSRTGVDPSVLAKARVALAGASAEERKVAGIAGGVGVGIKEIDKFAPLINQTYAKLNRTQYSNINAIKNAVDARTGGQDVRQLYSYIQSVKNAYSQVMKRGGVPTDESQRRADELINADLSKGQIKASLEAMKREGEIVERSLSESRSDIQDRIKAPGAGGGPADQGDDGWSVQRVQ